MNLYLAGLGGVMNGVICRECQASAGAGKNRCGETVCNHSLFKGLNILQSFYYCNEFTEKEVIPHCKRFMLDSGAFTFFSLGKAVDWNDYLRKYADFINRNNVDLFFELDIDYLVGYENVLQLRENLEAMTGKKCIPVWHKERGKEEFIKMCKEYDYVAIGGVAKNPAGPKIIAHYPWFIQTAHKYGAKIHGLGYTSLKGLSEHGFDSVDSTSWTTGNRFGHIYTFNGETMVIHKGKQGQRLADARKVALHNFREWAKFARHAETHL